MAPVALHFPFYLVIRRKVITYHQKIKSINKKKKKIMTLMSQQCIYPLRTN